MKENNKTCCSPTNVFGLTKAQLKPIVDSTSLFGPVASFEISVKHKVLPIYYGAKGEKVIPTFIYTTWSGYTGEITIFAKKYNESGPKETYHYLHLMKHNAPIPKFYGDLRDSDNREIIFLEYLKTFNSNDRMFIRDPKKFKQFLALMARFNAIKPSKEYAAVLQYKDVGGAISRRVMSALDSIWKQANYGKLGDDLKLLCSNLNKLTQLKTFAKELIKPIKQMNRGLCMNDCHPHCTGYRFFTKERLFFDVEFVAFSPRFRDVAIWLGAPDIIQHYCLPRVELAQYYLEQYSRWGGATLETVDFLDEVQALWTSWTFGQLNKWYTKALNKSVPKREILYRKLTQLIMLCQMK